MLWWWWTDILRRLFEVEVLVVVDLKIRERSFLKEQYGFQNGVKCGVENMDFRRSSTRGLD